MFKSKIYIRFVLHLDNKAASASAEISKTTDNCGDSH